MKVRVHYDKLEITGHHPGKEKVSPHSFEMELPDGLLERDVRKKIQEEMPNGRPLTQYTFKNYKILE